MEGLTGLQEDILSCTPSFLVSAEERDRNNTFLISTNLDTVRRSFCIFISRYHQTKQSLALSM